MKMYLILSIIIINVQYHEDIRCVAGVTVGMSVF